MNRIHRINQDKGQSRPPSLFLWEPQFQKAPTIFADNVPHSKIILYPFTVLKTSKIIKHAMAQSKGRLV